jgi:hypothetical protein
MMTREKIRALRDDIDVALAAVAAKHGLGSLRAGNASFTESTVTFKLEAVEDGGKTREAQRYEGLVARMTGVLRLPPLGTALEMAGYGRLTVTGCNTTGSKVLLATGSGRGMQAPPETVAAAWARQQGEEPPAARRARR